MNARWELPERAIIGGRQYEIHTDYRDILEIFSCFSNPDWSDFIKWEVALALFYEGQIPDAHRLQAMEYLSWFIAGGQREPQPSGPKLIDWEQDAQLIVADINKTAGCEVRSLPFLHWWTFLSWFHAIGEGQLSTVVSIRSKLARGKKLELWEKDFYSRNRALVDFRRRYSQQELAQKQRLEQLLLPFDDRALGKCKMHN